MVVVLENRYQRSGIRDQKGITSRIAAKRSA